MAARKVAKMEELREAIKNPNPIDEDKLQEPLV